MASVIIEEKDNIAVLKIKREIADSFEDFYKLTEHYIGECKNKKIVPKIIIDLSQVTFMKAVDLGALIWAFTQTKNLNGKTILVNPSEKVKSLLTVTKLITVFTITSMEEALKNN